MSYSPTTWVERVTKLGPTNLNKLETGLQSSASVADAAVPKVYSPSGRAITLSPTLLGTGSTDKNNNLAVALAYAVTVGAGSNGGRNAGVTPDSIAIEAANSGTSTPAAEFFAGYYLNNTVSERGSHQGIWNQMTVNEDPAGNDLYNEAVLYFGSIVTNRRGALSEAIEVANTVNSTKVARATAGTLSVVENNALAAYTSAIFGSGSPWIDTGSRILWLLSGGANGAGTGVYLDGLFQRAAIYVKPTSSAHTLLAARVAGESFDRFSLWANGQLNFGDGAGGAPQSDVSLSRPSAFTLRVTGLLDITNALSIGNPWTTNADAAVNGYVTVVVGGVSKKLATIA